MAPALARAIHELASGAFRNTDRYANNRIECDHGWLKARLRPMRGLKRDHSASVVIRGHALMQNFRRGHYELGVDAPHIVASRPRSPKSRAPSDPRNCRSCLHAG
jgi:transposase, IS6 family